MIHIHISPDTTIHIPNRLSMQLEYDQNTKRITLDDSGLDLTRYLPNLVT